MKEIRYPWQEQEQYLPAKTEICNDVTNTRQRKWDHVNYRTVSVDILIDKHVYQPILGGCVG